MNANAAGAIGGSSAIAPGGGGGGGIPDEMTARAQLVLAQQRLALANQHLMQLQQMGALIVQVSHTLNRYKLQLTYRHSNSNNRIRR